MSIDNFFERFCDINRNAAENVLKILYTKLVLQKWNTPFKAKEETR